MADGILTAEVIRRAVDRLSMHEMVAIEETQTQSNGDVIHVPIIPTLTVDSWIPEIWGKSLLNAMLDEQVMIKTKPTVVIVCE